MGDSEKVRRNNRGLVLSALRSAGPLPRTQLAAATGLSHASITAITQDMLAQGLLVDLPDGDKSDGKGRGRPAVRLGFNRAAAALILVEIDVNRARFSLVDYGGTLIDRIERFDPGGALALQGAADFVGAGIADLKARNPIETGSLRRIAVSLQGILDRDGHSLKWSPVPGLAGQDLTHGLVAAHQVPVVLHKRGRLLAEGTRWLDPALRQRSVATIFVGSTVAMGMTFSGQPLGRADSGATEFGHMNHVPGGALCRCGMKGCVEAYAADYGILRAAFSVPEHAPPAGHVPAAQYDELITRAQGGDRRVAHAFNLAGRAIGYGLNRLLAVFDPTDVAIVGPGARAFPLMRAEIEAALAASLVAEVNGMPALHTFLDESEPIFTGLMMQTLDELDQADFALLPAVPARA